METGKALYIMCNFIYDEWNLHRLVDHAYLAFPPSDHYNALISTLLGVPTASLKVAAEHVVSYILAYENYPLTVAGEMMGDIGQLEFKCLLSENEIS